MDLRVQTALIAAIVTLTTAVAVLLRSRRLTVHTAFVTFSFSLFIWQLFEFFTVVFPAAPLIHQVAVAVATPIPSTALAFFLAFLGSEIPWARRVLRATMPASIALAALNILVPFEARPGWPQLLTFVYVVSILAVSASLLYRQFKKHEEEREGRRLFYLLVGTIVAIIFGALDSLPRIGIPFPALGSIAVIITVFLFYQTLLRTRLLDLNEFFGRALVLAVLGLFIVAVNAVLVLWVSGWGAILFNSFVAALVVLILIDPLRGKVEEIVLRALFRESFELRARLEALRRDLANVIQLGDMTQVILRSLEESRRATHASIFLLADDGQAYALMAHVGPKPEERLDIARERTFVERLRREGGAIVLEMLERDLADATSRREKEGREKEGREEIEQIRELLRALAALKAGVVFPFLSGDALLGFLCLHDERLREAYSTDEIALLLDVASQATIVIENSKLYDRMKERDRLAALGEMSAGLAHEIRNPLGAIKGAAQYLETGGASEAKEFLGVIVEEVNRLDEVVSQFLDYARPLKGASTLLDLNAVVKKAALVWEAQGVPPGVEVHFALAPDLPAVAADPQQLKQVFINFALNAFEAMPKGGRLDITTSATADPFMGEDHVRVSFKDTGQGIGTAEMKRLFIPFFTTKEKGTGLGLAICQRIAEANGGTIEVRSRKGKGATFSLRLVAASKEAARSVGASSTSANGEKRVAK